MSKIVFDSYLIPCQKVQIRVYGEDGIIEQEQQYIVNEYGSCVLIVVEES